MRLLHSQTGLAVALLVALAGQTQMANGQTADATQDEPPRADRLKSPSDQTPDVADIDKSRFGPAHDAAYGAFQRGYYITALNLALPRAEAGDPAAQTLAAEIYARGLGLPRNAKKAAEWYAKAAEQDVPEAQFQYALMMLDGTFVPKDPERAFTLMQQAADGGNHLAEFNFAQMILDRHQGAESARRAVGYYERAAKAGVADAQYAMAQVYANGFGGKTADDKVARAWLLKAAEKGFDTAQLELGSWMVEGRGGPREAEDGFGWLRRAATGGNIAAQNRLAKLYRAGVGTEADATEAAAWYISARRAGLIDREMEDFLAGLTAEEMKEAIKRANRLR